MSSRRCARPDRTTWWSARAGASWCSSCSWCWWSTSWWCVDVVDGLVDVVAGSVEMGGNERVVAVLVDDEDATVTGSPGPRRTGSARCMLPLPTASRRARAPPVVSAVHTSIPIDCAAARRDASAWSRTQHPSRWSLTSPIACMNAYTVVGPDERPTAALEILRQRRRRFGDRRDLGRRAVVEHGVLPEVAGERAALVDQLQRPLRVVDRRADLAAVTHDAGVTEQAIDVALRRTRRRWPDRTRRTRRGSCRACAGS